MRTRPKQSCSEPGQRSLVAIVAILSMSLYGGGIGIIYALPNQ